VYKIVNQRKRAKIFLLDTLLRRFFYAGAAKNGTRHGGGQPPVGAIRKILAIRLAYIGDLVMTLPALEALKALYPEAEIHLLTSRRAAPVASGHPALDRIVTYDAPWFYPQKGRFRVKEYRALMKALKKESYDLVIDFRGDFRNILFLVRPLASTFRVSYGITGGDYFLTSVVPYRKIVHRTDYHLDLVKYLGGPNEGSRQAKIYLTEEECRSARELLAENGITDDRPNIGFCPGARERLKEWGALNFARLAEKILLNGPCRIILFGSESDREIAQGILTSCTVPGLVDMTGYTTLRQLMACFTHLDLVVANDSAPMHLAAALNVPVAGLFGPSKAIETAPVSPAARTVEAYVPCRFACDESACRVENHRLCMKKVTPDQVYHTCRDLLQ